MQPIPSLNYQTLLTLIQESKTQQLKYLDHNLKDKIITKAEYTKQLKKIDKYITINNQEFKIADLLDFNRPTQITSITNPQSTITHTNSRQPNQSDSQSLLIKRDEILKICGYSTFVKVKFQSEPVHLKWQEETLNDSSKLSFIL